TISTRRNWGGPKYRTVSFGNSRLHQLFRGHGKLLFNAQYYRLGRKRTVLLPRLPRQMIIGDSVCLSAMWLSFDSDSYPGSGGGNIHQMENIGRSSCSITSMNSGPSSVASQREAFPQPLGTRTWRWALSARVSRWYSAGAARACSR